MRDAGLRQVRCPCLRLFLALRLSVSHGQLQRSTSLGVASPQLRWTVCVCVCVCVCGGRVRGVPGSAGHWAACLSGCMRPLVCCLGPHRSSLRQDCCELGLPPFPWDVKQTPSHHCGCAPWAPSRRCNESRTFQNLGWKERGKEHLWNSSSGPASLHLFFCNPHPDY